MTSLYRAIAVIPLCVILCGQAVNADQSEISVDVQALLQSFRETYGFPGATVAYVASDDEVRSFAVGFSDVEACLLYTSPSPRDLSTSRMPSSA